MFTSLLLALSLASCSPAAEPPRAVASTPSDARSTLTIRVLSPDGAPAAGASIGTQFNRDAEIGGSLELGLGAAPSGAPLRLNNRGECALPAEHTFYGETDTRARPLIALSADRTSMAISEVTREHFVRGEAIELRLMPAIAVTVKSRSDGLVKLGRTLEWANVYVHVAGTRMRPLGYSTYSGTHELLLPAATQEGRSFEISAYGRGTYTTRMPLDLGKSAGPESPESPARVIQVDLPPSRLSTLIGKQAPEFVKIKGWKNGEAVSLASLQGKVVLLDFWGWWCGPCVHAMPELMETYEKYKDQGLVIVAVHDDSVASIAEMDEKLAKARADVWKGRDLPFLVALDGGGETPIPNHDDTARGATTATYGIDTFPTQVLIDRDGKVIGARGRGKRDQLPALMAK